MIDVSAETCRAKKFLAGNAVHMEVLGAFTAYVLSNVEHADLQFEPDVESRPKLARTSP